MSLKMEFCVNRNSKEFKDCSIRLDIDTTQLEFIVYEYMNAEGNAGAFPSDSYILSKTQGTKNEVPEGVYDKAIELWNAKYSQPIRVNTQEELNSFKSEISSIFGEKALGVKINTDGSFIVSVKEPSINNYEKRLQEILDNAPRDKQGKLLAPNGKPSNLTERQYAQVRTKEFKDWFGDWESILKFDLSKVNTSKVDIEEMDKPWRDNPQRFNKSIRIYLKGQHEKGYFEVVKDDESNYFSLHFKTAKEGASFNAEDTRYSTKEDRVTLFKEVSKIIPNGAKFSTWGSVSTDGLRALESIAKNTNSFKVEERKGISKETKENINIPVYQKGESNISKVVDENGEPLVVYHGSSNKFNTFSTPESYFTSDPNYALNYGEYNSFFLDIKNPYWLNEIDRITVKNLLYNEGVDFPIDGIIGHDTKTKEKGLINSQGEEYVVVDKPSQVKSAESNIGTFSRDNNNFHYQINNEEDVLTVANDIKQSNIQELKDLIRDTELQLLELKKDPKSFINNEIKTILSFIDSTKAEVKALSKSISIDKLKKLLSDINDRIGDFIKPISELQAINQCEVYTNGWSTYNPSKLIIQKDILSIKDEASKMYQTKLKDLENKLKALNKKLKDAENISLEDIIREQGLYFQKDILEEREKLKLLNSIKSIKSVGAKTNFINRLKRINLDPLLIELFSKAYDEVPEIGELSPLNAFNLISQMRYSDIAKEYQERIINPINSKLEEYLSTILKKYNIDIKVDDAIKKFGDITGVFDIYNKIIYVSNNRNELTLPEEFSHAFVKLMGAAVSKAEENKDFTFLFKNVENTSIYKKVFDEYKTVYRNKNGTPNINKIKEEAIGQALAVAITSNFEKHQDKSFIQKVLDWFESILSKFKNAEYVDFNSLVDKIAKEIVKGDLSRLNKIDSSNYSLLDYTETLANQTKNDGGQAMEFLKFFSQEMGNIITGSLSYRYQGEVYRGALDAIHDIDMVVPPTAHNISFDNPLILNAIKQAKARNPEELGEVLWNTPYFKKIREAYPKMIPTSYYPSGDYLVLSAVFSEDIELSTKFKNLTGSYASRLNQFTEEERKKLFLFDFFLRENTIEYINDPINNINLARFDHSFRSKEIMGRAKDIFDYQMWKLFDEFKDSYIPENESKGLMFQTSTQDTTTSTEEQPKESIEELQERGLEKIYDNPYLSITEAHQYANSIAYWISDKLTEYEDNPDVIFEDFPKRYAEITEEQKKEEKNKIKEMSRLQLLNYVGVKPLLEFCQLTIFNVNGNEYLIENQENLTDDILDKVEFIGENEDVFYTLVELAEPMFAQIEKASLNLSKMEAGAVETDYFDDSMEEQEKEQDVANEVGGNAQESWQITAMTIDTINSMSQLIRRELIHCYDYVKDKNGEWVIKRSDLGIPERIDVKKAVQTIIRLTQGSTSIQDMISKLSTNQDKYPWLGSVINRLSNKKDSTFRSQFFSVFDKHSVLYSVVSRKNGKLVSTIVNENIANKAVIAELDTNYKMGLNPLLTLSGVNRDYFETLKEYRDKLQSIDFNKITPNDIEHLTDLVVGVYRTIGFTSVNEELVADIISQESLTEITGALDHIVKGLSSHIDDSTYNPFDFNNGIRGNLKTLLTPVTNLMEDGVIQSVYESGKMYQSNVIPSYFTKLMTKFHSNDKDYKNFLLNEFGKYKWFNTGAASKHITEGWRNMWLESLSSMSQKEREEMFKHKVELNFNKHNYMKNLSSEEYSLSLITEYFSGGKEGWHWYKLPMMSNKPSSEFIRFKEFSKNEILYGMHMTFLQELSRIQTVNLRAKSGKDLKFIKNFDKRGKEFCILTFLNDYIKSPETTVNINFNGESTEVAFGALVNKKIKGEQLTDEEETKLLLAFNKITEINLNRKADALIENWKSNGVFESVKNIEYFKKKGIKDDGKVKEELRHFLWNDTFAAINILELTITDPAYYKNAEDLQKRFAQIHAPGIRAAIDATDFNGELVSDGKIRTLYLTDIDDFKSNIIDNIKEVFERKIRKAKTSQEKQSLRAFLDGLIGKEGLFQQINLADAQGYCSPTAYRKKALLFGRWDEQKESIYQRLIKDERGLVTPSEIQEAFGQPLKPFVYSQISLDSGVDAPLETLKVPVQHKNSEYLLFMADALLRNEKTSKPNLLRALFDVMENTAKEDSTKGIDVIQFVSAVKSGEGRPIDLHSYLNSETGEQGAYDDIMSKIGSVGAYTDYVVETNVEDYCIQQEIPAHFMDHAQGHGAQIRAITISELDTIDYLGNPVVYEFYDNGVKKSLTAREFKQEYERNIAENIREDLNTLTEELNLNGTQLEQNQALSKILKQEILSNIQRYGIDLLMACSLDKEGNFRIPLGDPIQSKRVEQLLNSIIKNRVNKQKLLGGPVVQVSNFGTTTELHIRFKDKKGNMLLTREEFEKRGLKTTYEEYLKENQGGIAYYEALAPAYMKDLLSDFIDNKGNIDIETIEKINPELLNLIGYRIPTEDKYSCAPIKIVGFLPRLAGDGIMLPAEITTITGSDFDIDKFYLIRKNIPIKSRFIPKINENSTSAERSYIRNNYKTLVDAIAEKVSSNLKLTDDERKRVEAKADTIIAEDNEPILKARKAAKENYDKKVKSYERVKQLKEERATTRYNQAVDIIEDKLKNGELTQEEYNSQMDIIDKDYDKSLKLFEKEYNEKISKLGEVPSTELTEEEIVRNKHKKLNLMEGLFREERKSALKKEIAAFLKDPRAVYKDKLYRDIKVAYIDYMYSYVTDSEGRAYRDNKIFDMTWAVLTHETSADKILNPGGFEPQKRMGYMISAFKQYPNIGWDTLEGMKTKELKELCYTDKNLIFMDTQIKFYEQNSAAGAILGMFAVQKVAHAMLENNGFMLDIPKICGQFTIDGVNYANKIDLDPTYNSNNELIGKILGSLVAAAADAVKDPVLNLMNINASTANALNTLIRIGIPFETAALLLSQNIIGKVLSEYNSIRLTKFVNFEDFIEDKLEEIAKSIDITDIKKTPLNYENLSKAELVKGLKEQNSRIDYKALNTFRKAIKLSNSIRTLNLATRFNSIANAVGPQIIDNLILQDKMRKLIKYVYIRKDAFEYNRNFYTYGDTIKVDNKDIKLNEINVKELVKNKVLEYTPIYEEIESIYGVLNQHPILGEFSNTVLLADTLFKRMPLGGSTFRAVVESLDEDLYETLLKNRKLFNSFGDFFLSYIMTQSVVNPLELKDFIFNFPKAFIKRNYKELYKDNPLIQAIKLSTTTLSNGTQLPILKVDVSGLDQETKGKLSSGWIDLYKEEKKRGISDDKNLAVTLFKYNFFRTGIGFSPKSFNSLAPSYIRERIPEYKKAYQYIHLIDNTDILIDRFIRNNWDNNSLVPSYKTKDIIAKEKEGFKFEDSILINPSTIDSAYFKVKFGDETLIYKRNMRELTKEEMQQYGGNTPPIIYDKVEPLGDNGEYFEITDKPIIKTNKTDETSAEIEPLGEDEITTNINILLKELGIDTTIEDIDQLVGIDKNDIAQAISRTLVLKGIVRNKAQEKQIKDKFC